jgi:molybdate transport system substrate-binding protein
MRLSVLVFMFVCLAPVAVFADEIKVFSGGAVTAPVAPLIETYQRQTGNKVDVFFGPMGLLQQKITAGERADVMIGSAEAIEQLLKQGVVVSGSQKALGGIGIGVAVRENAPLPDISTPEAFKQTLLRAKSLVYVDPTKGTSGKHIAGVLQRLGIAEAVKSKTVLIEGGAVAEVVARGEAEIGVQQISEILPVKGVKLVGSLPAELQKITTYTAGIMVGSKSPQAAAKFISFLAGKEGRAKFLSAGFTAPQE